MSYYICDNPRCEFHAPSPRGLEKDPLVSVQSGPKWVTHTSRDGTQNVQMGYEILHVKRYVWRRYLGHCIYVDRYLCESCHQQATNRGFDSL